MFQNWARIFKTFIQKTRLEAKKSMMQMQMFHGRLVIGCNWNTHGKNFHDGNDNDDQWSFKERILFLCDRLHEYICL